MDRADPAPDRTEFCMSIDRSIDRRDYVSEAAWLSAKQTAKAHLGQERGEAAEYALMALASGKLMFAGRRWTKIATYGEWEILYSSGRDPSPFTEGEAPSYYATSMTGIGISMGYSDLPALLADLREQDARALPPCSC